MSILYFNPNDLFIRFFFQTIGVPEKYTRDGILFESEAKDAKISFDALKILTGTTQPPDASFVRWWNQVNFELDPQAARTALKLIRAKGEKALDLFSSEKCPGSGVSARPILANMLGIRWGSITDDDLFGNLGVSVEDKCPYNSDFTPLEYSGVYFSQEMALPPIRKGGQSVKEIVQPNGEKAAGGFIADGQFFTAAHVLFDDDEKIRSRAIAVSGYSRYAINNQWLVFSDLQRDVAVLDIPDFRQIPGLKMSQSVPQIGDPVWVIGFPRRPSRDITPSVNRMIYTTGTVTEVGDHEIKISAKLIPGFSGGPVLNIEGEVVGVAIKAEPKSMSDWAEFVVDGGIATRLSPPYKK